MRSPRFIIHKNTPIALSYLWPLLLPLWVQHDPFFWDTVQLASKHAHFFYENGLRWAPLPPVMDSGHPPLLGYYLACCWTVLGKTLPVSHWAMLPFLIGCHYFVIQIARRWLGEHMFMWAIPVFWLDPVMAGQSVLVSPDILLVCFLLMSLHGILHDRKIWIVSGIIGLCLVSMRGMMCAGAVFIWYAWLCKRFKTSQLYFLPGFVLGIVFLWWHWQTTGWVGHHPASPWAAAFQRSDIAGTLRNTLITGWRFADFGRIGEWLIWGIAAFQIKKIWPESKEMNVLFFLAVFLLPTALLYQNLSAHRYLLPLFVLLHFVVLRMCVLTQYAHSLIIAVLLFLFSGNFWVYPHDISMGWDSTLAHLPYHEQHQNGIRFLQKKNVDIQEVGTFFPNVNTLEDLTLNGDTSAFSSFDMQKNKYAFVSNIYNDFAKDELKHLKQNWILVFSQEHPNGVWVKIFQKPVF
jgi:hypothetical protein